MNELAKPTPEASEPEPPSLAAAAALIGDPVRAAILLHLTDGSRRPASELAFLAGASPQAASAHLTRLVDGGLLTVENQGRHRFFSIASGEVAEMIEGLANWADRQPKRRRLDPALCRARLCYDHLAGQLGVAVFDRMAAQGWLIFGADGPGLSPAGLDWCRRNKLDPTVTEVEPTPSAASVSRLDGATPSHRRPFRSGVRTHPVRRGLSAPPAQSAHCRRHEARHRVSAQ